MTPTPTTFRKKYTTCSGRDKPLRYPLMTIRSKQWYTKTSRLPNSFVNVSIGRPPLIRSRQHDHRSDGRWSQNFKYIWLGLFVSQMRFCQKVRLDFLSLRGAFQPCPGLRCRAE